ncbi:Uncharacterized protein PBTT_07567 [Plasmodiophora brassicae]|uniref:Uncharacterized protein n=1 Tax=Plasmodiophora brassicae TaxID=37360 RepID=A0A3P3YGD4_PLABS|nr:unnamed protein product [Plasmodiophora brassicae]
MDLSTSRRDPAVSQYGPRPPPYPHPSTIRPKIDVNLPTTGASSTTPVPRGEVLQMQTHLDSFLRAIRQHVVPVSPSATDSDVVSNWNGQRYNIVPPEHQSPADDGEMSDIALSPDGANASSSMRSTVGVFTKAFETGNFHEVDAITRERFEVKSDFGRAQSLRHSGSGRAASQSLKLYRNEAPRSASLRSTASGRQSALGSIKSLSTMRTVITNPSTPARSTPARGPPSRLLSSRRTQLTASSAPPSRVVSSKEVPRHTAAPMETSPTKEQHATRKEYPEPAPANDSGASPASAAAGRCGAGLTVDIDDDSMAGSGSWHPTSVLQPMPSVSLIKRQNARRFTSARMTYEPEPLPGMVSPQEISRHQQRLMRDDFTYGSFRSTPTKSRKSSLAASTASTETKNNASTSTPRRRRRSDAPLETAFRVIKHGRRGKPKPKTLTVDLELGVITWGTGSILINDVKQIRRGRQTKVLSRAPAAGAYEGLFASLVTKNRTVDLELRSRKERNHVVSQLQRLISNYVSAEGRRLTWNRYENTSLPSYRIGDVDDDDDDWRALTAPHRSNLSLQGVGEKVARLMCLRRQVSDSWTAEHF